MSTSVNYVGNSYSIPAYGDTGYAQGPGNLSAFLIALATGNFTIAGGTVTLTADANLGPNFGLLSLYFKSITANIASAGVVRLANAEFIEWRNATNAGDNTLTSNASNQLAYAGGDVITTTAGSGYVTTTPDGTKTYRIYVDNNGEVTTLELT